MKRNEIFLFISAKNWLSKIQNIANFRASQKNQPHTGFFSLILNVLLLMFILNIHCFFFSFSDMFSKKLQPKRSEDIKKSAAKVLDAKKDTPTRAKHLRLFLDNAEVKNLCFFVALSLSVKLRQ